MAREPLADYPFRGTTPRDIGGMTAEAAPPVSLIARIAFALGAGAALAALASGPAYRLQLLELDSAFTVLGIAAGTAAVATALAIVAMVRTRPGSKLAGFGLALAAALIGGATSVWPALHVQRAKTLPPIHDVTTDTLDPPRFGVVLAARGTARNRPEYAGEEVAAQQRLAYPDLVPFDSPLPPRELHSRAVSTVRAMRWKLLSDEPDQGRIEATDTTLFFGFADDIAIRILPRGSGSRLDIRSASRIGKSDLGTNARRIRAFLQRLASP